MADACELGLRLDWTFLLSLFEILTFSVYYIVVSMIILDIDYLQLLQRFDHYNCTAASVVK